MWILAVTALLAAGPASPVHAQPPAQQAPPPATQQEPPPPATGTPPPPGTAEEPEETTDAASEPAPEAAEEPSPSEQAPPSGVAAPTGEAQRPGPREGFLPRLDVYFPEGDLDLRVSRLINEVFFEGQVKYNFIDGDITAFLRYRYYGYNRTTQFTVFDAVEFESLDEFSSDFERVRGALLLFQWPHSYHHRTFLLTELDRISSNKPDLEFQGIPGTFVREGKTNTFVRYAYQIGTPSDARSNAIAGETRARRERLFTAFREIGPGGAGFTGAITYGFPLGELSDFDYVKLEFEALKRFDLTPRTFLIGRLRGGSFPHYSDFEFEGGREPVSELDGWTIPRGEYFKLDGRDNLRGLGDSDAGTEQIINTWELFIPWFLDAQRDFLKLEWQNWYWVLYAGAGNAGNERNIYTNLTEYTPDVGVGFESSFRLRKYRFFLSGIVAQALKENGGVEAHLSVKSYR